MNDPNELFTRGWNQPSGLGGIYPGLGNPGGFGGPSFGGDPFLGPPALFNPSPVPPFGGPPKGLFFGEIKQIVDRLGGIDGILSGIGKFQKFMSAMQQLAPLVRLFVGKAATQAISEGIASPGTGARPKRKRRPNRSRRRPAHARHRSRRR